MVLVIQETLRATDLMGRMGGDEFAVWLAESSDTEASETLSRLQAAVTDAMKKRGWPVTLSIGAVSIPEVREETELRTLLQKADALMYQVKKSTKNGISVLAWKE